MIARCVSPTLFAFAVLVSACNKPSVESYRVPKEVAAQATPKAEVAAAASANAGAAPLTPGTAAPAPDSTAATMAATPVATASGAELTWTAPESWKTKPATAMRKATFTATGQGGDVEIAVTAFPGNVGGELANLNRWRAQTNLPPTTQEDYEKNRVLLDRNGLKMIVVDIAATGSGAQRTIGAMIPFEGSTWFVKMGPAPEALVGREKSAFMAFLETVKPAPAAK